MARPKKYDEITVRNALRDVFWKRGFEGATYAHIMEATGLKKGSLYASFGDKNGLYTIALQHYNQTNGFEAIRILSDDRLTVGVKLNALFGSVLSTVGTPQAAWGCLICNAAADPAQIDDENRELIITSVEHIRNTILFALPDAKKHKVDHILAAYFGARALVRAGADHDRVCAICDSLLSDI